MGTGRNRAPVASSASTATSSSRDAVISRRDHHHHASDDALDAFLRFAARAKTTLASADGKDKVLSFCQYACMFVGGGWMDERRARRNLWRRVGNRFDCGNPWRRRCRCWRRASGGNRWA